MEVMNMAKYKAGQFISVTNSKGIEEHFVIITKKRAKELQSIGLEVFMFGLFGQPMIQVYPQKRGGENAE